ncbi:MAG: molybdopterin-dependent oxidoreductase, partial [Dermatophilaceae bacterium]
MAVTPSRRTFLQVAVVGTTAAALPVAVRELATPPAAVAAETPGSESVVTSVCEMCTVRCPILVRVRDGKVVRIEGNPKEKATLGAICARGNAGISLLEDPDRVRTPLIRVGKRGEGKFRKASWEEAYRYIAERLTVIREQYGPEALGVGRRPSAGDAFLLSFAKAFGTPNIFSHESTCPMARNVALEVTLGTSGVAIDYSKVDYLVSFGRNHMETIAVPQAQGIVAAQARGARLVYLDPRRTPTSTAATTWLQPQPGTDLAFVLAMIQVLIAEDLYDHDFVKRYTHGFEQLAAAVLEYTPEWAATKTGIPAATIRDVARDFGGPDRARSPTSAGSPPAISASSSYDERSSPSTPSWATLRCPAASSSSRASRNTAPSWAAGRSPSSRLSRLSGWTVPACRGDSRSSPLTTGLSRHCRSRCSRASPTRS